MNSYLFLLQTNVLLLSAGCDANSFHKTELIYIKERRSCKNLCETDLRDEVVPNLKLIRPKLSEIYPMNKLYVRQAIAKT